MISNFGFRISNFQAMSHTMKVCGVVTCLMLLGGCAGPRDFLNENDTLRRENLQLKTTVDELNHKLESRLDQIAALEQATNPDRPKLPGVEPGDIPVAVSLRYGMYTGAVDTNADGSDDLIRLYFQPLDQKRRFIPVAADVRVQVVVVTPGSDPLVLADMPFTTADLDRTYRTGVTGTHYTVEVPLPEDMPQDVRDVVVDLQVTDAATGRLLSLERSFPVKSK